jgi:hypothetical protein
MVLNDMRFGKTRKSRRKTSRYSLISDTHSIEGVVGGKLPLVIVGNMQAIQSGFYLSHDKFSEIISNVFGHPTLHGSIEHETVLKLSTVKKCRACSSAFDFFSSSGKNFYMLPTM